MRGLTSVIVGVVLVACTGGRAPTAGGGDDSGTAGSGDAGSSDAGSSDAGSADAGTPPPVTTANPPGEHHTGALSVTLTSVPAATIKYTTDGSDPKTSTSAQSGASPVVVTLSAPSQITLTFFASDASGSETPHSEVYSLIEDLQPASISGRLIVPDSMKNGQAAVWIYSTDPRLPNPGTALRAATVSPGSPGGATYKFEGLPAGSYWVAGEWWPGQPTGTAQSFGVALRSPITLDPSVAASSRADFVDVYVGECDPAGGGVDGEVVVGTDLLADTVAVVSYTQPLAVSSLGNSSGYSLAIGTGDHRPYALCDLPAGTAYLIAAAEPTGAMAPTEYSANQNNPLNVTALQHTTIYLGAQSAGAGSISGGVQLNGPLLGGAVQVIASGTPWTSSPELQALTTLAGTSSTSYSYTLASLPAGTWYLVTVVQSADNQKAFFPAASAVTIPTQGTQNMTVNLVGSVGRIQGTLTLTNVPAGAMKVALIATLAGTQTTGAEATIGIGTATSLGTYAVPYVLFGLADDSFYVTAIVDENNDGNFTDDLAAGHDGTAPTAPTITAGNSAQLDFTVALH